MNFFFHLAITVRKCRYSEVREPTNIAEKNQKKLCFQLFYRFKSKYCVYGVWSHNFFQIQLDTCFELASMAMLFKYFRKSHLNFCLYTLVQCTSVFPNRFLCFSFFAIVCVLCSWTRFMLSIVFIFFYVVGCLFHWTFYMQAYSQR